jgi:hypothetical protein
MSGFDFIPGAVMIVQPPPGQPRHPAHVIGRMGQRLACAGWVIWAARRDRPQIEGSLELLRFEAAFSAVGLNIDVAIRELVSFEAGGGRWDAKHLRLWRRAAVGLALNMRTLRKFARCAGAHEALQGWDGPRRPAHRRDSAMISRAVALYETQPNRETHPARPIGTG